MINQAKIKAHFKRVDPVIYGVMKDIDLFKWFSEEKPDYFVKLCSDIIGQQLSGKVADAIFNRFLTLFPQNKITPRRVLKLTDQQIRDIGTSWAKVRYLKDLAQRVIDKTIYLDQLEQLNDQAVVTELTRVKGIGPWTAEMFLIFTLRREDVFSFGDLGLNKAIKKLYGRKRPEVVIKPWSPYRSFGCLALWQNLV